jgi:hypothetical protein
MCYVPDVAVPTGTQHLRGAIQYAIKVQCPRCCRSGSVPRCYRRQGAVSPELSCSIGDAGMRANENFRTVLVCLQITDLAPPANVLRPQCRLMCYVPDAGLVDRASDVGVS